jgi:hypothetical protein
VTAHESALNALLAWNTARQEVNRLRAERNSHRCTETSAADYATGDMGQGPCWQLGDSESMCDECKERQKLTEPIEWAVRKASELRQKMQRQAVRLQKVGSGNQATPEHSAPTRRSAAQKKASSPSLTPVDQPRPAHEHD